MNGEIFNGGELEHSNEKKVGEKINDPERNIEDFEDIIEGIETVADGIGVILEMDFTDEDLKDDPFNVFESLKRMIGDDFAMPKNWESCDDILKNKIKEIADNLAEQRGAKVQDTPNGPEITTK